MLVNLRDELVAEGIHYWDLKDEGDVAGHRYIMSALTVARPDDVILSEEAADNRKRLSAERVWIIDPIDGTNEFAEHPRHDWAIHIALWESGELTAASVALPTLGITFDASPAAVVPPSTREKPLLVTSRSRNPYCAVMVANALGCDVARLGSAGAKAMAIVMGEADIYVHDGGMYQWDSAAPAAVAKAAGLHVSRIDGSELKYNQESLWLPDFLVCRIELAEPALKALNP
ncbi:MAG: 3'(2'),5'-bisphosphate nucleotidase CysQ [Actinobacteria bacterium]|nr:3'(2'),5'-bisphosphate nucleotidase CysQ [Actinomycetota bacterium]MSX16543.1 3'(2'),5'-bisphosphate nucleotidase CysQ [Actinomycetota bacterium]MSX36930.1 3'(2'),5'-bisphosphate nucleotidase CysQ [Actinomycetota bacterium]MSX77442.1 3'(2'),5'-bisphosphate nucleotidase CysQ [Actinomycetota bacterium]MSZ72166.1 3'(2'),5'-bisphosphate nucleotidase CysQ [Actinomycetota bacterium]